MEEQFNDARNMAEAMNNKNKLKRSDLRNIESLLERVISDIADIKKDLSKPKKTKKEE